MTTVCTWKHETTDDILQARAGIDLFDDEAPGMITIYIRYADGSRAAVRDIKADHPSADRCLAAWCNGQFVKDYREAAHEQYYDKFRNLLLDITYRHHHNCDDAWLRRQLHRAWELADNQPLAVRADRCFSLLHECCPEYFRKPA